MRIEAYPQDWFFVVGDDATRAWSTAASAYVDIWPDDAVTRISGEDDLAAVLRPYGLRGPVVSSDDFAAAIEAHIDQTAQARGYRGTEALASYATSTIPAWAAEATAFVAWRDAVWGYAYAQMAAVQAGQRPQPSVAELVDELPVISWPS